MLDFSFIGVNVFNANPICYNILTLLTLFKNLNTLLAKQKHELDVHSKIRELGLLA